MMNDDWDTNGWYTDTPEYDLTASSVPVYAMFVDGNDTCDVEVNKPLIEALPGLVKTITWYDGRTHDDIVGDNDDAFVEELCAQMIPPAQALGQLCSNDLYAWV